MSQSFRKQSVLPDQLFQKLTDLRVDQPHYAAEVAKKRKRRNSFVPSGRMNIVAADHPARGSVSVGDEPFAMADRHDLLARIVSVLQSDLVDGVLASMDIIEELFMLHGVMSDEGEGFLDGKLLIASLNRGGLPGAVWELNDPITGTDGQTCESLGIDAVKMLLRFDYSSADTLNTIRACVGAVNEMNSHDIPVILEPLPVVRQAGMYVVIKEAEKLIPLMGITAALGSSSRNLWLKIPYTDQFKSVLNSTTLPVVILGGEQANIEDTLDDLRKALNGGHQVRGAMYGRNVLYPLSGQPIEIAEAIGNLVHH